MSGYNWSTGLRPSFAYRNRIQNVSNLRRRHLTGIISGIVAAFALTVACYWPSLGGPFLFDDIPNLEIIGDRGGLNSVENYAEFIMSGQSGPLGRPLSLASFTLDGQNWPSDPRPFRITNLVLHLINGLLVFLLSRLIFASSFTRETAEKLALVCMTLWLLHPLLVSTTAYIIQRMTQLSSLFTLLGLLSYLRGRMHLPDRPRQGWAWILAGMGTFGLLALLSKETGILLPLYALAIEVTVFNSKALVRRQRATLIAVLCMPLLALIFYMLMNWDVRLSGFDLRPFTVEERLLTQGVVLLDYLRQIVMPQLSGLGLFHDDFPVSKGFLDPVRTIVSLTAIATMLFLAVRWRKAWPLLSLGILWFFAGHSLEAGPLPLELYFEHRNYLASLGPLLLLCSILPILSQKLRGWLPALVVLFIAVEALLTWQSAIPWGDENRLMQIAVVEHPDSLRAQQYVANQYIIHGNYSKALAVQEGLAVKYPANTSIRLSILNLRCILNTLTVEEIDATKSVLMRGDYDRQIVGYFGPLMSNAVRGTCASLDLADVHALFDAVLGNPTMAKSKILSGATHYNKGIAYKTMGDLDRALEQFDLSYQVNPEIDVLLLQVVWSLENGEAELAEHYLYLAKQHGSGRLRGRSFRSAELTALQQEIDRIRDLKR